MSRKTTYVTRRRDDVPLEVVVDFVAVDLPQQPLDLLLDLPLAVDAHRDDARTEEQDGQNAGRDDVVQMRVPLLAHLVVEAARRLVVRNRPLRPLDLGVMAYFVHLEFRHLVSQRHTSCVKPLHTDREQRHIYKAHDNVRV